MSKPRRFPLTYDEEFDADIHKVLIETPQKRRSERLRQLIRLGLLIELGSHDGASTDKRYVPKTSSINTDNHSESPIESVQKVRKPIKFGPPS